MLQVPPVASSPPPRLLIWISVLALVGYGIFMACNSAHFASGADQSGYFNSARLLVEGRLQDEERVPPEFGPQEKLARHHFMPLGYVALQGNPHLPPTYPVGLPLHLALAKLFLGWTASAILIQLLTGLGALWLCYAVARELGVEPWLAAAGAVVLAAFPVFIFISIQTLSDTPATTWCLFAVWLALRARRGHWSWAVGCGAAFAMAVFVRATNAVLLPALLVFLGASWKRIGLGLLGGLPGALWLAYYNHTLYGSALASGYGPIHETFKLEYGPRTIKHFLYWFAVAAPTALLVLPFAAQWRHRARDLVALALWFGIVTGVYVFYEVSYETWWCLRFILPAFPALIILSLLGIERLLPRRRPLAGAVLAIWACASAMFWIPRLHALYAYEHEQPYAAASIRAREIFPPDSLLVCFYTSGSVFFYTPFSILRWDLIDQKDFVRYVELTRTAGRPVRAMLFDGFEDNAFKERVPGEWKRLDTIGKIGLWELVTAQPAAPEPAR